MSSRQPPGACVHGPDPGDEYRGALAALQQEFDERPDVIDLKRRIERCEEERRQCIAQAKAAGISKQGSFRLKVRTRKQRTVIPKLFFAKHGAEAFCRVCDHRNR